MNEPMEGSAREKE